MKIKVKAKELATAVKVVLAVHDFGEASDNRQPCVLSASDKGLVIESAKLGAYIIKKVPGKLLRPGKVGLNAKELDIMKLSGDVVINSSGETTEFADKRTTYKWISDDSAVSEISEQREALAHVKPQVKIPAMLMRSGSTFAHYKSETGDLDVQITCKQGLFEYLSLDHLGSARYEFREDAIQVKNDGFHFILGTSLIGKIMKHFTGEDDMVIGVSDDQSIVRMRTSDLDIYHPTVDKEYMSSAAVVKAVTKGKDSKCVAQFTTEKKDLKDAIERILPIGKKASDSWIRILVDKEHGVRLKIAAMDNSAHSDVKTEKVKVGKKPIEILARTTYFHEFIKAAPSVPLTVQSWNEKFLRILVKQEKATIEYLAMMLAG